MQKLLIVDGRKLGDGGIGVYIENLIHGLLALEEFHQTFRLALIVRPNQKALAEQWKDQLDILFDKSKPYSFSEYFLLPWRLRKTLQKATLFHAPHFTLPFFLRTRRVVTIHDVIHLSYPKRNYHRLLARLLLSSALRRAQAVITVSKVSKEKILSCFNPSQHLVTVIPNAFRLDLRRQREEECQAFRKRLNIAQKYFIFIGSDRPHKGFKELLAAWRLVCDKFSKNSPLLLVIGRDFSPQTKKLVEKLNLSSSLRFTGEVTAEDLALYYQTCSAVILPSKEEGFGFVALEALYFGATLLSTPLPSIQEIAGSSVHYLFDLSPAPFASQIERVFSGESELIDSQIERKKRLEQYQLETMARKTFDLYLSLLGRSSPKIAEQQEQGVR